MSRFPDEIIVIGGSAGALDVLLEIIPSLGESFPIAVVIVVHLPPQKDSLLSLIIRERCAVPVEEAEDKMPMHSGVVYVAPPDYHLLIEKTKTFSLTCEEPINYSRPSIDVFFGTAADAFGTNVTGIILTGASRDGAAGLKAIVDAGGRGVVQAPDEAEVPLMPQAAIKACPGVHVMTTSELADFLRNRALDQSNHTIEGRRDG